MFKTITKLSLIVALATQFSAFAGGPPSYGTTWTPANLFVKATNGAITTGTVTLTSTFNSNNGNTHIPTSYAVSYSTNTVSPLGFNMASFFHDNSNVGSNVTSVVGYSIDLTTNTFVGTVLGSVKLQNNSGGNYSGTMPFTIEIESSAPQRLPALTKNSPRDGEITLNGSVSNACNETFKTFTLSVSGGFTVKSPSSMCGASSTTYSWYFNNNTPSTADDILISPLNSTVTSISLSGANLSVGGYYVSISTCKTRFDCMPMPPMGCMPMEITSYPTETSATYNFFPNASIVSLAYENSVCPNSVTGLTVSVTGTLPTYIWNTGATTAGVNVSSGVYMVTVNGLCNSVVSSQATINALPNTFFVQSPIGVQTCAGSNVSFEVSATGAGAISYAWSNGLSNTNIMSTTLGGEYMVTATGTCGSVVSSNAIYESQALTKIITQPVGLTLCGTGQISVSAVGTNLNYIWSNGNINTTSINATNTNDYTVTVNGVCGSEISNTVNYTKLEEFTIVTVPFSKSVLPGATAVLVVSATGSNVAYNWSTGATTPQVTLAGGNYEVSITGSCGFNTYSPTIREVPNPTITGIFTEGNPALATVATITGLGFIRGKGGLELYINNISADFQLNFSSTSVVVSLIGESLTPPNDVVAIVLSSTAGAVMYALNNNQDVPSATVTLIPIDVTTPAATPSSATVNGVTLSGNPANSITISGAGFANRATVTVNGVALNNISIIDGNIVVATLPSGFNTNAIRVVVQNPDQSASSAVVISNPTNTSAVSATVTGITSIGNITTITVPTFITVSGLGFTNNSTVTINGVSVPVVAIIGSNTLVVNLPVGVITSTGAVNIQVANPNQGTSASIAIIPRDATLSTNLSSVIARNEAISIYPNPTSGEFSIVYELSTTNYQLLTIYNAIGTVVYSQPIVSGSTQVNANLPKGIYLIKVGAAINKLVVE